MTQIESIYPSTSNKLFACMSLEIRYPTKFCLQAVSCDCTLAHMDIERMICNIGVEIFHMHSEVMGSNMSNRGC